jgi:hypothetical protein
VTGAVGEVGHLARRYWRSLIDERSSPASVMPRGRQGYGLWQRYLAALFGISLPVRLERQGPAPTTVKRHRAAVVADSGFGRFFLPLPPARGVVAAAGLDEIVLKVAADGGRVEYLLHRDEIHDPGYRLEVVIRTVTELPLIATVWYSDTGGRERTLLIPIAEAPLGPPSSVVRLNAYDPATRLQCSQPAHPRRIERWIPEAVHASIAATADLGTIRAWREVADALPEQVGALIRSGLQ